MKRMLMGLGLVALTGLGSLDLSSSTACAQTPGETVVYETVSPGTRTVTYGERVRVRQGLFKTVVKERPVRYVTTTPPVVTATRVVQPAPVVQQTTTIVEPATSAVQQTVIQTPPVVETRVVRPMPVIRRVFAPEPVIQTRYYYIPY